MIRLHTLGKLDLRASDGHEIRSVLAQPKRLALLAYLALQLTRGFQRRDHVLALFWPDLEEGQARAALNRALYYLRHSLGDGVVLSRGDDEIGLAPGAFWCDAAELETAAKDGRDADAVKLYSGDLLEGFQGGDAPGFARWLDTKREALRAMASRSAWALADEERLNGNAEVAAAWGRWALARSPLDEASLRRLVRLLDAVGDRAGAVREFEDFARRVADELELSPAPETTALIDSIRSRGSEPHTIRPRSTLTGPPATQESAHAPARANGVLAPRLGLPARRAAAALGAAALLVATALPFLGSRAPSPDASLVLVEPIQNRTGDATFDVVTSLATDQVARTVADVVESVGAMAPLPAGRVVRPGDETPQSGAFHRGGRAGTVVSGELYREAGALRFHVRITDAVRGDRVWPIPPLTAGPEAFEAAVPELSQRVTGAVVALLHPYLGEWFPVATAPPTYDALVEYLRALRTERPWERGEHFERAARLDTTFVWALLEGAWQGHMLDRGRAHAIVVELDGKRERMNQLQTTVLNSLEAGEVGDRRANYQSMAIAAQLAPSRFLLEYALSARSLHLPNRTLELLDRFDRLRPGSDLPQTWPMRTELLHHVGRHQQEVALTRRARARMPRDMGALWMHARALAALGEVRQVEALVDTALSLPLEVGYTPGTLMLTAAEELRAHGYPNPSNELTRRAIEWYRSTPPTFTKANPAWHDYHLAQALYRAGEWSGAELLYRKLADTDPPMRAEYYGMLGAIAARRQHRSEAEAYLDAVAALAIPTEAQPDDVALARARIAAQLGDAVRALAFLREGYGGGQGVDLHTDPDFASLIANDRDFQEFVRPKG